MDKSPYHATPALRLSGLLDAGLQLEHLGLDALAFETSSRYMLDGRLSRARVRGLHGWTRRREMDLRAAGAWIDTDDDGIELVDYLRVNRSRADIEELRARGAKGGAATAAKNPPRAADGTFVAIGDGVCPVHGLEWRASTKRPGTYYCPATAAEGEPGYGKGKGRCTLTPNLTPNRPPDRTPNRPPKSVADYGQSHAQEAKQVLGGSVGFGYQPNNDNDTNSVVRSANGTYASAPVPPEHSSGRMTCYRCDRPLSPDEADRVWVDGRAELVHSPTCRQDIDDLPF